MADAFTFLEDQGREFCNSQRGTLFWRQVIGYMQRHLPACYLQAFAQGFPSVISGKRSFTYCYHDGPGIDIRSSIGYKDNLGYSWALNDRGCSKYPHVMRGAPFVWLYNGPYSLADTLFPKFLRTKRLGLEAAIPTAKHQYTCVLS